MIVESCVKNIIFKNLNGPNLYPTDGSFFVSITVAGSTDSNIKNINGISLDNNGNGELNETICWQFDTSITTTIVSYKPTKGQSIIFELMGDPTNYGSYPTNFPNPTSGSQVSVIRRDNNKNIQDVATFDGTISYTLFHRISYVLFLNNI